MKRLFMLLLVLISVMSFGFNFDRSFYEEYNNILRRDLSSIMTEEYVDDFTADVLEYGLPNFEAEVKRQGLTREETFDFLEHRITTESLQRYGILFEALLADNLETNARIAKPITYTNEEYKNALYNAVTYNEYDEEYLAIADDIIAEMEIPKTAEKMREFGITPDMWEEVMITNDESMIIDILTEEQSEELDEIVMQEILDAFHLGLMERVLN